MSEFTDQDRDQIIEAMTKMLTQLQVGEDLIAADAELQNISDRGDFEEERQDTAKFDAVSYKTAKKCLVLRHYILKVSIGEGRYKYLEFYKIDDEIVKVERKGTPDDYDEPKVLE